MKRPHNSEQSGEEKNHHPSKKAKLDKLFNSNDLKIDEADEVYLFECPRNFDTKLFLHKVIDPNCKNVVKDGKDKYSIEIIEGKAKAHFIVGKKIKFVANKKIVTMRKQVKSHGEILKPDEDDKPVMPSTLPIRHPLLGSNFEDHMKEVSSRLKIGKKKRN